MDVEFYSNKSRRAICLSLSILLVVLCPIFKSFAESSVNCGRITIANMTWQSAAIIANIDKLILEHGYGCNTVLLQIDSIPALASMAEKGEPDIAPEIWVNGVKEIIKKAIDTKKLHYAAEVLEDGGIEGWWVPQYLVKKYPEIKSIEDALKKPELFAMKNNSKVGAVYNCPTGWECSKIMNNLFRGYKGSEHNFKIVDPGSAAALDGTLLRAYYREEPWLGYYWRPTSLLSKVKMVKLDPGVDYNEQEWENCTTRLDCKNPKPNEFPKALVHSIVTDKFKQQGSMAYDYIAKRSFTNETMEKLLAWMEDNQATGTDTAYYFLDNFPELWGKWVSADIAVKIKKGIA